MKTTGNKVEIQGFLGRDAEVKPFESGRSRATFSLATSERYKNSKGEWVSNTVWHNVTLWCNSTDGAPGFLKKGALVAVQGKLSNRKYTGKDGLHRDITEVVAHRVEAAAGVV